MKIRTLVLAALGIGAARVLRSWLVPLDPEYRPVRRQARIHRIVDDVAHRSDGPVPLPLVGEAECELDGPAWAPKRRVA